MYREISFSDYSKELLEQLVKGAYLTVKKGDRVNTMTIGWGSLGYMWYKPTFTAMVRYSRYTYELIDSTESFTISLPLKGQLKQELMACGTKSGRDVDKIKACSLTLKKGESVDSPVIDECDLHIECRIIYKHGLDEKLLPQDIKDKAYPKGDYHVLYYGEILKMYIKE